MLKRLRLFTASDLKIIAFIAMIVDHIAYFLYFLLNDNSFYIMRAIGRISMPIFTYLIYQGIKNTSNIVKYRRRIIVCAIITQILSILLGGIALKFVPEYNIMLYKELNILFSFYLSIIIITILENLLNNNRKNRICIEFGLIIFLTMILVLYNYVNIEYGLLIPLFIMSLYFKDKGYNKFLLYTSNIVLLFVFASEMYLKNIYLFMLLAMPIILFYNGKKGKKYSKIWYFMYPIQLIVLFSLGMISYYFTYKISI